MSYDRKSNCKHIRNDPLEFNRTLCPFIRHRVLDKIELYFIHFVTNFVKLIKKNVSSTYRFSLYYYQKTFARIEIVILE